jgi:hypothetical protein
MLHDGWRSVAAYDRDVAVPSDLVAFGRHYLHHPEPTMAAADPDHADRLDAVPGDPDSRRTAQACVSNRVLDHLAVDVVGLGGQRDGNVDRGHVRGFDSKRRRRWLRTAA